jgi:hypothetical protein
MQGTVEYSAESSVPPVFPNSPTIQFQESPPDWLDAYSTSQPQSNVTYFVANIVFPTPVILHEFLMSMLKVVNGATACSYIA